jgi:pimeloyl-ACP methyl ester carboxylesterase
LPTAPSEAPARLNVPGHSGAWFYPPANPTGRSRVIVYLHGRGSDPEEHCRRLQETARVYGWLLCPIGPGVRGSGREWRNDPIHASDATIAALDALIARFPRRVRRHDNVLVGFSEGAFVGMNVALRNPRTFPRWWIIASDDRYIDGEHDRLVRASRSIGRVYLLTGGDDSVLSHSRRVSETLGRLFGRQRVRLGVIPGMPHELPSDSALDRSVLDWLTRG